MTILQALPNSTGRIRCGCPTVSEEHLITFSITLSSCVQKGTIPPLRAFRTYRNGVYPVRGSASSRKEAGGCHHQACRKKVVITGIPRGTFHRKAYSILMDPDLLIADVIVPPTVGVRDT